MRRIILITNSDSRCGNATYGRLLKKQLERWYEVSARGSNEPITTEETKGVTFVVNWHPFRVPVSGGSFEFSKRLGCKFLVVYQNTHDGPLSPEEEEVLGPADVVVTHEKVAALPRASVVPHGILEVEGLASEIHWMPLIGTAGFPFPWKGFDTVVRIARELGTCASIVAPGYPGQDFSGKYAEWRESLNGALELVTDFRSEEEVVRTLSRSWVNLFPFESHTPDDGFGQSGSARLGVASMRPVIFSLHRKLRTLHEVSESSYIAQGYEETREAVRSIVDRIKLGMDVRLPSAIIGEQSWSRVGEMYRDLIEGMWA